MPDQNPETLIGPRALAELLDVKESTIEKWRCTNRGPAYVRVGRLVRYRQPDVDAWLAENRVATRDTPNAA